MALEYFSAPETAPGKYYGIDLSTDLLAFAKKRQERLGVKNAEFCNVSVQEFCERHREEVDVALALDFSEHVHDQEWLSILAAIRLSLKPNGVLYLHTPNGDFLLELMKHHNFILKQFPVHVAVRNAEANLKLLQKAGFRQISVERLPHYNFLKILHGFRHLPWVGPRFEARLFIQAMA